MSNPRIALVVGAVLAGSVACSASPSETTPSRSVAQRLDDDAGAPDAAEAGPAACAHPICATGDGMQPACNPCAATLCAQDPYCCNVTWDVTCVGEVASICGQSCTVVPDGGGADAGTCDHPICAAGSPLVSACNPCATQLCAQNPYCCSTAWDVTCVGEVASICGQTCQ